MSVPDLPSALVRMQIALAGLPRGPVRADIEQALAIATFDAEGAGDGGPLHGGPAGRRPPRVPTGPMFGGLPADPITEAMDELQRALLWEADTAAFEDAALTGAVYLRAAGHLDRAAAALAEQIAAVR